MISLTDCIGLCGLTPEEVEAIAEYEHVPEIVAATMGAYLLDSERGPETIRDMMIDDIRSAVHRHDLPHARHVMAALRHFLAEHPGLSLRP